MTGMRGSNGEREGRKQQGSEDEEGQPQPRAS